MAELYLAAAGLALPFLCGVGYILYKHHTSGFMEATTDDGDNEFEQLEAVISKLKELNDRRN